MTAARRKIQAGAPLPEAEVLRLCNEILAATEAEADEGDLTSEAFVVPEVLLELRKLIGTGQA